MYLCGCLGHPSMFLVQLLKGLEKKGQREMGGRDGGSGRRIKFTVDKELGRVGRMVRTAVESL